MMLLSHAQVKVFRSITDSGVVPIDPYVTVLVGQNESGKTAFLQALHQAVPAEVTGTFNVTEDYPRKSLIEYQRRHESDPDEVVALTYQFQKQEIENIN